MSDNKIEFFFQNFKEHFNKVSQKEEKQSIQIQLGTMYANLQFSNQHIAAQMSRSLAHLISQKADPSPALTIYCFEGELGSFSFPWTTSDFEVQGLIKGMNTNRFQAIYQHGSGAIIFFDQVNKEGIYYIDQVNNIPYWEISFPFRTLLHWWSRDTPYQLLHAGGIGSLSSSMIISGKSGSGKSSTCLSSLLHPQLMLAGDDYVLVDTQKATLYSLYNCTKIEWDNLPRLSFLQNRTDEQFKHAEKAMIFVKEQWPDKILRQSSLVFSLIPQISGKNKTTIIESNPAEALKSIAPTTLFQLPLIRTEAFGKCVNLIKQLSTHQVLLGTDPDEIAESLSSFIHKN